MLFVAIMVSYVSQAYSQDLFQTKKLTNGDTTYTVNIAPFTDVYITFADSSNTTVDTFKVYLVNSWGDETLAAMIKYNDTTANSVQVPKSTGTVIGGDGTVVIYKLQVPSPFKVKIVRTNVGSISGTLVTGKVSHVTVRASRPTGYLFDKKKNVYTAYYEAEQFY